MSGRACSVSKTTNAVYTDYSRVEFGTGYCPCWNFMMSINECTLSEVCYGSFWAIISKTVSFDYAEHMRGTPQFQLIRFIDWEYMQHWSDVCHGSLSVITSELLKQTAIRVICATARYKSKSDNMRFPAGKWGML